MADQRPHIGVGIYLINGNSVLLGKRKNAHGDGYWSPPGGHLEFGETPGHCAQRELQEETGLIVTEVHPLGYTNDFFIQEQKHYITLAMVAYYQGGEPQLLEPDKCEGWQWFELDALPQPLFLPVENFLKMGTLQTFIVNSFSKALESV